MGLEALVERDSDGFTEWLGDFARGYGVEVTDDLSAYKPAVERLGIECRNYITYVKKRVWNRLDKIDGWDWDKARIWRLPTELAFDGDLELPRLERAVQDGDATLRRLRMEVSGEAAGAVMPPPAAGRAVYEQRGGAGGRRKQDKIQCG